MIGVAYHTVTGNYPHKTCNQLAAMALLAAATLVGAAINFSPVNPIKALFWSAVINGVVAVPVMATMMLISTNANIMGKFTITGPLRVVGWLATVTMAAAAVGMGVTAFG